MQKATKRTTQIISNIPLALMKQFNLFQAKMNNIAYSISKDLAYFVLFSIRESKRL